MATRPTQLHDVRARLHTVLVRHDIPNACLAARDGFAGGRAIAERAPIVRAAGAA